MILNRNRRDIRMFVYMKRLGKRVGKAIVLTDKDLRILRRQFAELDTAIRDFDLKEAKAS